MIVIVGHYFFIKTLGELASIVSIDNNIMRMITASGVSIEDTMGNIVPILTYHNP